MLPHIQTSLRTEQRTMLAVRFRAIGAMSGGTPPNGEN